MKEAFNKGLQFLEFLPSFPKITQIQGSLTKWARQHVFHIDTSKFNGIKKHLSSSLVFLT